MHKMVLFGLIACTFSLKAEEIAVVQDTEIVNNDCTPSCSPAPTPPSYTQPCCPPPRPRCSKPCPPPPPPCENTLCSAAPLSSNGWYIFGDLLYWHADVDHSDWAFKNRNTSGTVISGPNHALNFKWSFGFRVGIGANIDYDQWDTNVYYTWFQTKNSNSVGTSGAQSAEDLFGLASPFTQGKIHWTIHYSMIDWELGRWFFVSKRLSLRPHIGIKNGWISQHVKEEFTKSSGSYHSKTSNKFWGVGAAGGFNTAWNFATVGSHHFDFFGDFAGALMYGHFNVKQRETGIIGSGPYTSFRPSNLNRNLLAPMLQGIFGLSWDTGFNCDRCHFGIRAGYEFQYWFRQNQMLRNEASPSPGLVNYSRSAGDLGLQGLTIDFKFDF